MGLDALLARLTARADTPELINGEDDAVEPVAEMSGNLLASFRVDSDVDRNIVTSCPDCQHFARPGLSAGYCGGRDDLPLAYGENHPLRRLPADRGASCDQWQATE